MMLYLWDSALMRVLPKYYGEDADPQTLYRIKMDMLRIIRDEHHITITPADQRAIRVQINAEGVHLTIPPHLLTQVVH